MKTSSFRTVRSLTLVGGLAFVPIALAAQGTTRYGGQDRNRDGVITRAEWRGNEQSFRQHDTNRDGVLSGDEMRAANAAGDYDGIGLVGDFGLVDRDGNGHITSQEWRRAFTQLDDNRDGSLTPDELRVRSNRAPVVTRAFQAGRDRGVIDGRQAGREDGARRTWDIDGQLELEQADAGYVSELGPRDQYQAGYREGFRQAYTEAYGPRR